MSIDLSQPITFDEALVAFTEEMPFLTESDVKGFFAASNDERALIVQTYKDAGKIPSASGWDVFLKICGACVQIVDVVLPLTSAIQAVYGITKL